MTRHAQIRLGERLHPIFKIPPAEVERRAHSMLDQAVSQYPGLRDCVLVLAQVQVKVTRGRSTGDMLCAVVRNRTIVTVLLRNSQSVLLDDLPHFVQ